MGKYHVLPEEGHTYWYEVTTGPLPDWRQGLITVEVPDDLIAEYEAARQEVARLDDLVAEYAGMYQKVNECVACGRSGLHHYGSEDHDLDPIGIDLRPPALPGGLSADTGPEGDV